MTSIGDLLPTETYRDMQLLHEVAQTPYATQRDLARRIGAALGLTNLTLRRLADKGYIKMIGSKKSRVCYLITPLGLQEKARLTNEFMRYSMHLYSGMRRFLSEQLSILAQTGNRRIVLCGTDQLAELACLTIQEMGLELIDVVEENPDGGHFLGYPVRSIEELKQLSFDQVVVVSLKRDMNVVQRLVALGIPSDRIISLILPGMEQASLPGLDFVADLTDHSGLSANGSLTPAATDVVVLCGGLGSRLGPLTASIPKPLLPVGRHPFLLRLLLRLEQEGFSRFILAAHHLSDHFGQFLHDYKEVIPDVELVVEPEPLGTGGALRHAANFVRSPSLVAINGDSWVSQSMAPVLAQHREAQRSFTVVAVQAVNVEGGAQRKGVWRVGPRGEVLGFAADESVLDGWVNAGTYVLEKSFVESWPNGCYSLESNLETLLNGKEAGIFCSTGRLLDIGTPQTYHQAHRFLESSDTLMSVVGGAAVHAD